LTGDAAAGKMFLKLVFNFVSSRSFSLALVRSSSMQSNNAKVNQRGPARPEQKVEVALEQRDGTTEVVLRASTWTDGLGWCCQKTLRLDAAQTDELHRALTVARHRLTRQRAEADEHIEPAQVIQFPALA
jgi:hypothetical protein